MNIIQKWTMVLAAVLISAVIATPPAKAQSLTTLYSFCSRTDCADGLYPRAGLIQATDGNFYGTTVSGGTHSNKACHQRCGTIFEITPGGTLTTLHSFDNADGSAPYAGLIQGADGNFYGTTSAGGAHGHGTVFELTLTGTLTTLHSFDGTDGSAPYATLIQGTDGNFYGTTTGGGAQGYGTVFEITQSGTLITLHSFDITDGLYPWSALIQATDGTFYGTTLEGGANGDGTIFKIPFGGALTTLHSFDGTDGANPIAGLIQADGEFYGTTSGVDPKGGPLPSTIFKITPGGTLTTLQTLDSKDGKFSEAALVLGGNADLYGTAALGGSKNSGTVFRLTPGDVITRIYSFDGADGRGPEAALMQATDGTFYGTTYEGGTESLLGKSKVSPGTIFGLSLGLHAFVETRSTFGTAGAAVRILGTDLTGATSVTFNGTTAAFTVVSASEITTTVPTGATTGYVDVVTPGGTLTSNVVYTVNP